MPGNSSKKKPIEQYEHKDKERLNNHPVGLVTPETDLEIKTEKTNISVSHYQYDPHLDPQLHWAGKAERTLDKTDKDKVEKYKIVEVECIHE